MRVLNFEELNLEKKPVIDLIINGSIFIHPTDTIYGLGCNAELSNPVRKIRELKSRPSKPFSVIAPSLEWIRKNCVVSKDGEELLRRLPGQYTLIFKLRNNNSVAKEVNLGLGTLGIRIPNHWIKGIVAEAGVPIVTTSVNPSGEDYMTSLDDLDPIIKGGIDFVLYEGKKEGKPSRIIDLSEALRVIER